MFRSWINRITEGFIPVGDGELILRYPTRSDMKQWIELRAESQNFLQPWEPLWPEDDLSPKGFLRRLRSYKRQVRAGTGYAYFLVNNADNQLLGGVSLTRLDRDAKNSGMLGYWMGEKHAGLGIMRDTVPAFLDHAFTTFDLRWVDAACVPTNLRSISLLRKTGFEPVGVKPGFLEINGSLEDHLLLRLHREQSGKFSVKKTDYNSKTSACVV